MATVAEKKFMGLVATLPCLVPGCCNAVQVHHINSGQKRLGDFFVLPLCPEHHEGNALSIGQTKKPFIREFGNEIYLLFRTRILLSLEYGFTYTELLAQAYDYQDEQIIKRNLRQIPPEEKEDGN